MPQRIETRIEQLEAELGIGAEDEVFVARLGDEDARDYRRIMRCSRSGDFEAFVRGLPDEELQTLHAIHRRALAAAGIDIDHLLADDYGRAH